MATVRDKLDRIADERFVGRADLCAWLETQLGAELPDSNVCYVHGPGGVGKTTLLKRFGRIAASRGVPSAYVDCRRCDGGIGSFTDLVVEELGDDAAGADAGDARGTGERGSARILESMLAGRADPLLLLVDTVERLPELDAFFADVLIPALPDDSLLVIGDRRRPSEVWQTRPGLSDIMFVVPLRNFSRDETTRFLARSGVPDTLHDDVLRFSHGHPLALSLVADSIRQKATDEGSWLQSPDIIKALLDRFVAQVPTPGHRAAIESTSVVRSMTEELLAAMLNESELADVSSYYDQTSGVRELFNWLRDLSFMEAGPDGVVPHEVARRVLAKDLAWRNRTRMNELHDRARAFYSDRLKRAVPADQASILVDYIYLHRDNPVVRPFFSSLSGAASTNVIRGQPPSPGLVGRLRDIVATHEGEESAGYFEFWLRRQPDALTVFMADDGVPVGFLLALAIHAGEDNECGDPAVGAILDHLAATAPLRQGERATIFRHWMVADSYQRLSRVQSQLFVEMVRHYFVTPHLAYSFVPAASPGFWGPIFSYADIARIPDLAYAVGDTTYGVFGHDWRARPTDVWLRVLAEREKGASPDVEQPTERAQVVVLSRDDFSDAVRDVLREFTRPWKIEDNPLLASSLVAGRVASDGDADERTTVLLERVKAAVESLSEDPAAAKGVRALTATYLKPSGSQEQVAEALGLPYSTLRRHIARGIADLTEILWREEIG